LGSGNITTPNVSGVAGAIQFSDGSAFASDAANLFWNNTTKRLGVGTNSPSATTHFKGSGSTSATTSLLVQNSAGTQLFKIADDGRADFNGFVVFNGNMTTISSFIVQGGLFGNNYQIDTTGATCLGAAAAAAASALLDIRSTTRGFLPPRMTTTQKNAIASPATGLMVMDITTLKLCVYNGSSWVDLH
jgi:hypothetical protein